MSGEQVLLRLFRSTDQVRGGMAGLWGVPAYEWIVQRARRRHGAGATVFRGVSGFGRCGAVPLAGWHIAHHLPVVVEIVDSGEAIVRLCREEDLAASGPRHDYAGVRRSDGRYRRREAADRHRRAGQSQGFFDIAGIRRCGHAND